MTSLDAFDVPVLVRRSSPLVPGRRPNPSTLDRARQPWPAPSAIPPDGLYRVSTTWRDVIDAAISVGRDPTAWLSAVPALAWSELIARRSPLAAYLGRRPTLGTGGARLSVEPNVVYRQGTERSARAAFGYRIGMTMAEWACRGLMGLGPTTHAEAVTPPGAGPAWATSKSLPDLIGLHPATPSTWMVEAKGRRKLMRAQLLKGARQLSTPRLLDGAHMRILAGASLEPRLFMTIDVEHVPGAAPITPLSVADPEDSDDALLALTRSRMLLFLCLSAIPATQRRVVPVGAASAERVGRAEGGTVALLEHDPTTRVERAAARNVDRYRQRPAGQRHDMLTGQVPGTDLIIGMSRRLFAACRGLATVEQRVASTVDRERPAPDHDETEDMTEEQYEIVNAERRNLYRQVVHVLTPDAASRTRAGFSRGQQQSWDELIGERTRSRLTAPAGFLEAATADTYLALDVRTAVR